MNLKEIGLKIFLIIFVFLSSVSAQDLLEGYTAGKWGDDQANPCLEDVVWSVKTLRRYGDIMGFHMNDSQDLTVWNHLQGVQRLMGKNSYYLLATRSANESSSLYVVKFESRDKSGMRFRSNRLYEGIPVELTLPPSEDGVVHQELISKEYTHAGGIQIIGNYLVIPIEGSDQGNQAKIVFYNVEFPRYPIKTNYEVYIGPVFNKDVGTASITKLNDGRYLLIGGGPDADPLYFYISNGKSLKDTNLEFDPVAIWKLSEHSVYTEIGDNNWGAYQSLNIINQRDGKIFLVGTHQDIVTQRDWLDLFRLEIDRSIYPYKVKIIKVANRHMYSRNQCDFNAAAGIYIDPHGRLIVYATEHDNDGPNETVKFMEFRNQYYPNDFGPIDDAWVELYQDINWQNRSLMIDYKDRHLEYYKDFNLVEGFNDKTSSARWTLPSGYRYTLFKDSNFGQPVVYYLVGTGTFNDISDLDVPGFGISSARYEGESLGNWYPILNRYLSGKLSNSGSPYLLAGNVYVPSDKNLIIESGVKLIFKQNTVLNGNGPITINNGHESVSLVSSENHSRGLRSYKFIRLENNGQIKIY